MKSNYSLALLLAVGASLTTSTALRADDANGTATTPAPVLVADNENNNDQDRQRHADELYRCYELSVDAFGTASLGQYTIEHWSNSRVRDNTQGGAGVGLNYFITRNFGIGADAYSENTSGPFIDSVEGNLILRFPLGQCGLAPYVFAGGGNQFDLVKTYFGQAGAGLEFRFTRQIGMFVDARAVLPNETKGFGVGRLGMRFAF
jgi:hypothetical protein